MKTYELTDEEVQGLGDIISGTIGSIISYGDNDTDDEKAIAFWNGIRVKLSLEPVVPVQ